MTRQLRKLAQLSRHQLHARDGEIGRLKEILFDDRYWSLRYFVVHTGNWMLGKDVLIVPSMVSSIDADSECLNVELTREQIENSPEVDTSLPISRHAESEFYGYYGLSPYWKDYPSLREMPEIRPASAAEQPREPDQPNLRSSSAVTGYRIHAQDGEIGHVEDFILDDHDWAVRYLEVSTRNWLPGRHVLGAPIWIHSIDWRDREVIVNLRRETIETAPDYDAGEIISNDYQLALYKHYGMKFDHE